MENRGILLSSHLEPGGLNRSNDFFLRGFVRMEHHGRLLALVTSRAVDDPIQAGQHLAHLGGTTTALHPSTGKETCWPSMV